MFSLKNSVRAIRVTGGLNRYGDSLPKDVREENETYLGLHNEKVPVKIFYPGKPEGQTIVIYPGASPFAEEHPAMIMIGRDLASIGYLVLIPRIPPLKELNLSEEIIEWMIHFYRWVPSRNDVNAREIVLMGMSFGGAMVLKCALDKRLQVQPPKSILAYGTYYDIETALRFLITGKLYIDGKVITIMPNEWGLVVLFYNYLSKVNVGYNTENIFRILKLRVQNREEEAIQETEKLSGKERKLAEGILNSEPDDEINRIAELIWKSCAVDFQNASPKTWCDQIRTKVFVMHGANDSMSPFTESVKLAGHLPNSRLLISYLFEHREMSKGHGLIFRIKELYRIAHFMYDFIQYNEQ